MSPVSIYAHFFFVLPPCITVKSLSGSPWCPLCRYRQTGSYLTSQSSLSCRLNKFQALSLSSQVKCCSPKHLGGPPLNLSQFINVFLVLGSPDVEHVVCWVQGIIFSVDRAACLGSLMFSLLLAQTPRTISTELLSTWLVPSLCC